MKLWVAAQAAAVLEQRRIVAGDPAEQRFDSALYLDVARGRVSEQGAVMHERTDQVEDQVEVDFLAQVPARVGPFERCPDSRARRVEQRGHKRGSELTVPGTVGEQRTDHAPGHSPESGDEQLEALIEIAQRAAGVRRPRLAEALSEGGEHQALTTG